MNKLSSIDHVSILKGELELNEALLLQYENEHGDSLEHQLMQAKLAMSIPDYQKALTIFFLIDLKQLEVNARVLLLNNIGICYQQLNVNDKARQCFTEALKVMPHSEVINYSLGFLALKENNFAEAIDYFLVVIKNDPTHVDALNNLAVIYIHLNDYDNALNHLNTAINAYPSNLSIIDNLFYLFQEIKSYENISKLAEHAKIHVNGTGRQSYFNAIVAVFNDDKEKAYKNFKQAYNENYRGSNCLPFVVKYAALFDDYELVDHVYATYTLNESTMDTTFELINIYTAIAQFEIAEALIQSAASLVESAHFIAPYSTMAVLKDNQQQKNIAIRYVDFYTSRIASFQKPKRTSDAPIRIGYLSADFNSHPVGMLSQTIIENHNHDKFNITLYSMTKHQDAYTEHFRSAARFKDMFNSTPKKIAHEIYQDEIDILVDISGLTSGSTGEVQAYRPASIQAHMIGYPGTMGNTAIDYYITTEAAVPPSMKDDFVEDILYLPECVITMPKLPKAECKYSREDLGLPNDKFILGCFNAPYRIDEQSFRTWLEILKHTKDTVLCISPENSKQVENLRQYVADSAIDPSRLITIDKFTLSETWHNTLIDLMLDTFTISGGTANHMNIWAEVPVLALAGKTPQSRTAASVLAATDLHELICRDLDSYVEKAIAIVESPQCLASFKETIQSAKKDKALFNESLYMNQLESLYEALLAAVPSSTEAT